MLITQVKIKDAGDGTTVVHSVGRGWVPITRAEAEAGIELLDLIRAWMVDRQKRGKSKGKINLTHHDLPPEVDPFKNGE